MSKEQLLRLWAFRMQGGDQAGADEVAAVIDQQDAREQAEAANPVPSVPQQDVPVVPPPTANLSPADNLANQTTANEQWNQKIETSLDRPGFLDRVFQRGVEDGKERTQAMLEQGGVWGGLLREGPGAWLREGADKATQMLYPDRYSDFEHLKEQAEVTPGLTGPQLMGGQTEIGPDIPGAETAGMIGGAMLAPRVAASMAAVRGLPGPAKAAALIPLLSAGGSVVAGGIRDIINKGPFARTPVGEFDVSSVGKTFFPNENTVLGRLQSGGVWGAGGELAVPLIAGGAKKVGQAFAGVRRPEAQAAVRDQIRASENLSKDIPENIAAHETWERMGQTLPGRIQRYLPERMGGAPPLRLDPTGRVLEGRVSTPMWATVPSQMAKAAGSLAPLVAIGRVFRKEAAYATGTAYKNMQRWMDEISPGWTSVNDLGEMIYTGAQKWGGKRAAKHKRLYDIADKMAAKLPGVGGRGVGYVVPTAGIKTVAQTMLKKATDLPRTKARYEVDPKTGKQVLVEAERPMAVYTKVQDAARQWASEALKLQDYATVSQIRNLQRLVIEDLNAIGDATLPRFIDLEYRTALKQAVSKDMVAELGPGSKSVANAYAAADRAVHHTKTMTQKSAAGMFEKVNPAFWQDKALMGEWVEKGSREADEMFRFAFKSDSPEYIRTMRTFMGPETYKTAVGKFLQESYDKAVKEMASPGFIQQLMAGTRTPIKFHSEIFKKELGLGAEGKASGALDEMLKLLNKKGIGQPTAGKITPQLLNDFTMIMERYPLNQELATMAARRIPLAGAKGALSLFTLGTLKNVGGGAAAGATLLQVPFAGIVTALYAMNRMSRVLTNDKMLRTLVNYGKEVDRMAKYPKRYSKAAQRAMFVKAAIDLGFDDDDVDESAVAVYGKLGRAYERTTHFTKKPISRFSSGVRAARLETGL